MKQLFQSIDQGQSSAKTILFHFMMQPREK